MILKKKKKQKEIRRCKKNKKREILRGVTVKIGLERINIQKGITVEALLDTGTTELVMSSEFSRK